MTDQQIIDLFAGPGGWDVAAHTLGLDPLGLEWDDAACATRAAAGLRTLQVDVAEFDPSAFSDVEGVIASPPCPDWSIAGSKSGMDGTSGYLVREVPRWVSALRPRWIACEQVPSVLPVWRRYAAEFDALGYSTWCGELDAVDYGVAQNRRRAVLLARRDGVRVGPPEPTHGAHPDSLFGSVLPHVSMAQALSQFGWGADDLVGFPRRADSDDPDKVIELDGVLYRSRDLRSADQPAFTLTGKCRSWLRFGLAARGTRQQHRATNRPAPTLAFGHDAASWSWTDDPDVTAKRGTAERLTVAEASVLQSFPPDYPWQASRTKQFEQIANAVPPLLAAALLRAVTSSA